MSEDLTTQLLPTSIPTALKEPAKSELLGVWIPVEEPKYEYTAPVRKVDRAPYQPTTLRPWSRPRGVVL